MSNKIAVIGLGHFGSQLALQLVQRGAEVLGIDQDMEKLNDVKDQVTHTVCLDSREERALQTQDMRQFDAVVVGIGDDFEATLLTVVALQNIGVKRIIVRATADVYERILQHLGISEIVMPTKETATRLANSILVQGVQDAFALPDKHGIFEIQAPEKMVGKTIGELKLRERYGVSLITIKRCETKSAPPGPRSKVTEKILGVPADSTIIENGDILILFAQADSIIKLSQD